MKILFFVILTCCLTFVGLSAKSYAHEQSVASFQLTSQQNLISANWQISFADLVLNVDLDIDKNSQIQWWEIKRKFTAIEHFINESIKIKTVDEVCNITLNNLSPVKNSMGMALNMSFNVNCENSQNAISEIQYPFVINADPLHVSYYDIEIGDNKSTGLFSANEYTFTSSNKQQQNLFITFVKQGVVHILIGIDHLAFLTILIFSALMIARKNLLIEGKNVLPKQAEIRQILAYITTFTLAHSITILISWLNIINLPIVLVEIVIAGSVMWGAWGIIRGKVNLTLAMVFVFGLIHGMGFANVLADLVGDVSANLSLFFAFNIGVEIGQIIFLVSLLTLPKLIPTKLNFNKLARYSSSIILVIAGIWLVERTMGLSIIS